MSKNQLLKLKDAKNQSFADFPNSARSRGMLDFRQLTLQCQIAQTLPSKTPNRALRWGLLPGLAGGQVKCFLAR